MSKEQRLININHEINLKLKEEGNASGLIEELLNQHYNANLSNDITFLNNKIDENDLKINALQNLRNSMTERVRVINQKNKEEVAIETAKVVVNDKKKDLEKFLVAKIKEEVITFEEYRAIKHFSNFEDCVTSVMEGSLDLRELADKVNKINEVVEVPRE